jgi:hypothetical protein
VAGVLDLKIGGSVTTIYRGGDNPEPTIDESDKEYFSPNFSTAVRCASNASKPFM